MAITLKVKSLVFDKINLSDTDIATALNDSTTYVTIYGFSVVQVSDIKAKAIVIYA